MFSRILSHGHQKTNDGPDANPEWIIFGIQKKSQAILRIWEFQLNRIIIDISHLEEYLSHDQETQWWSWC